MKNCRGFFTTAALVALAAAANAGVPSSNCPCGYESGTYRQINITGATLFNDYFTFPAGTNDFIDVDGDGCFGFGDPNCIAGGDVVDQLALDDFNSPNNYWTVQVRAIGSIEGITELLNFHACCDLPEEIATDNAKINRAQYALASACFGTFSRCNSDLDMDGLPEANCTPVCLETIDIAIADVPTTWATSADGAPAWNRTPTSAGYGLAPGASCPIPNCNGGNSVVSQLPSLARDCDGDGTIDVTLNGNTQNPDAQTIFDTTVVWSPIGLIANRGTGLDTISYSQARYHWVTGRFPNGMNLQAATRDVGSGTRNGAMNSLGIDPSWGRGENLGERDGTTADFRLGPCHRVSNAGGSSAMEEGVQMNRLAIGYTGLAGSSRAVADALGGRYEILNVLKDTDGATIAVRPDTSTALFNCDPNTAYQIGGPQTFATLGNPAQTDPNAPDFMCNQDAADYLRNLTASITAYVNDPGANEVTRSPGQQLAQDFILLGGTDCLPNGFNPDEFLPNANLNVSLQQTLLAANAIPTPAYGAVNPAGLVPNRTPNPDFDNDPNTPNVYDDGSASGAYVYRTSADPNVPTVTIAQGQRLGSRNALSGDFNNDGVRDANDIAAMVAAVADPLGFEAGINHPGNAGQQVGNYAIAHILGDFDGNGNFDSFDVRYFADGLAMVSGQLDRKVGFTNVDVAFGGNFFGTDLQNPAGVSVTYVNGASRFDLVGSSRGACAGAAPYGADGVVNCDDINYIAANFGDWSNIDDAQVMDLSCDMNGDLVVNCADILEYYAAVGFPDLDLNGTIGLGDLGVLFGNYNQAGVGFAGGDLDGSGTVGLGDLGVLFGVYGQSGCGNYGALCN